MIINGKHVVYECPPKEIFAFRYGWMKVSNALIMMGKKTNSIYKWTVQNDQRKLKHYQDMSIELDMIHEYVDNEHRYLG